MAQKQGNRQIYVVLAITTILIILILSYKSEESYEDIEIYSTQHSSPRQKKYHLNLPNISTPHLNISSYRTASDTSIAWEKFRNGSGKLIHFHARKAGGSTIKQLMWTNYLNTFKNYYKMIGKQWNTSWESVEFWTYIHGSIDKNRIDGLFDNNPYGIFIAHFRDPVQRIISQYDFEWRWGCQRCGADSQGKDELNEYNFMRYNKYGTLSDEALADVNKYKVSNTELDELINNVDKYQNVLKERINHRIGFNAYLHNYYLWMFCCNSKSCNIERDFIQTGRIKECMDHAMRRIMTTDVILIEEWFNDKRTYQYLDKLFFGDKYDEIMNSFGKSRTMKYNAPNKRLRLTKRGRNLMVNSEVVRQLTEFNKWDIKLYEFAKQVAVDRYLHQL